ncbi:MAG: hypothetical protein H0V29_10515 [Thermoleophilaceae bacterium]|nr:hypothetical protein [Thermoleophilaceae bacterium]
MSPRRILAAGFALALTFCAFGAANASASPFMVSIMQDDNALIYSTHEQRVSTLNSMKRLGVDAVRITVLWEAIAPRRRINGSNPKAYPRQNWDRYDDLVREASTRGISVYMNITFPGPRWAQEKAPRGAIQRTWKPDPKQFGRFVKAVGRRYNGGWTDENAGRRRIPKVGFYSIGNEPNQGGWLEPQAEKVKGAGLVPTSPALYRKLLIQGANGLLRSGHKDDLVLIGETAPLGVRPENFKRPLRPALFLRELFCLDRGLRPYRGKKAAARDCGNVRQLRVLKRFSKLSFGHHPYTKTLAPGRRDRSPEAITMANIGKLPQLLDRIAKRTNLVPSEMPILLTEFGYETSPPDPFNGIRPELQARYINEGDYLAWKQPRVFATTQFLLNDVPPQSRYPKDTRLYWFTYQSGLFSDVGVPKPAATAYAVPFHVAREGGGHRFWGQVRFTPNGADQQVYLQVKIGGQWQDAGGVQRVNNAVGFWDLKVPNAQRGQTWRAVWASSDLSQFLVSREVLVP